MKQTLLTVALLVLILASGFVWYRYVRAPSTVEAPAAAAPAIDPARLEQYRELRRLDLDASVFFDPLFRSLDVPPVPAAGVPLVPSGRSNPFAPF